MSIQSEAERIQANVAAAYAAAAELGATMPEAQNSDNLAATVADAKAVLYTSQTLTDEQKAQARENIGAISAQSHELLQFTYTTTYPNPTTFEYSATSVANGYGLFKQSRRAGGVFYMDWDTSKVSQFEIILYLFDADGNADRLIARDGTAVNQNTITGGHTVMNWVDPKVVTTASGYVLVQAPFSCDVPAGYTVMVSIRTINANSNTIFPDGGFANIAEFYKAFPTFFDVRVIHDDECIRKYQGTDNTGLFLGIDDEGNVTPTSPYEKISKEFLQFTYTSTYPNNTTFVYNAQDPANGYWLYKESTISGGTLSVDWDTSQLTQVDTLLYLFKNGLPYKISQGYQTISGDNADVLWAEPGSIGYAKSHPFTLNVPADCTIMISMRDTNAIYPDGSIYNDSSNHLYEDAPSFFSVVLTKTESMDLNDKLDKTQNKPNRIMVTDASGEIVPGWINPQSTVLRGNWDTVIHRGWISGATENTLPAFFLAKENGYDWVECDVRVTSDNIPVLAHDTTITGTTADGTSTTLTVSESTFAEIQAVTLSTSDRFGEIKTCTLAELFDMTRLLGMKILLDIKSSGEAAMKAIAQTVLRYGMTNDVVYMPINTTNAAYITKIDKNANFDFVMFGTAPTADTDFSSYTALLTGANRVNLDIQANTWEFAQADIDAINAAGLGLTFWNVLQSNLTNCLDAGAVRITKHNNEDAVDLDAIYLATKTYW